MYLEELASDDEEGFILAKELNLLVESQTKNHTTIDDGGYDNDDNDDGSDYNDEKVEYYENKSQYLQK